MKLRLTCSVRFLCIAKSFYAPQTSISACLFVIFYLAHYLQNYFFESVRQSRRLRQNPLNIQMADKKKIYEITGFLTIGLSLVICVFSAWTFSYDKIGFNLIGLVVGTLFAGAFLNIQLPRTKIHITAADAIITLAIIVFGTEVAVFLAILESINGNVSLLLKGVPVKPRTFILNGAINTISVFAAGSLLPLLLNERSLESVLADTQSLMILLSVLFFSQFLWLSAFAALFISLKSDKPFRQVWNEYAINTSVVYITGAIIACLTCKAFQKVDLVLFFIAAVAAVVVYLSYKNYVNDIKATAAKAEQADRLRAEQAENHVIELQHYISELKLSGIALKNREEQFRYAAFHDSLTDLPNRSFFSDELAVLLESNKSEHFAVLFLDLNRFKNINDSLGHSAGDLLLINIAKRLRKVARKGDVVSRFGGDEFAVILRNITNSAHAIELVKRFQASLSAPFTLHGRRIFSSSSIGIVMNNSAYRNADDIIRDADIAMYYAKEHSEHYAVFDQAMHTKAVGLMQTESDLGYALERNEFCLHYQPIIKLNSTALMGFEALIRWNHPTRGLVSPAEFIPLSEDTGLVIPMTFWVIREVCEQINKWQKLSPKQKLITVSVNISGKHFAEPDMVEQIEQILSETKVNPLSLKLEITESAVMANAENAIEMLRRLKNLGLQLSIDDFGTGYSSLSYLHRFPTDTLKVDRSFVNKIQAGSENCEIVKTIVSLAKALNMKVIAEGIETVEQFRLLQNLDCEYGQGFLFSRPVPQPEAESLWLNEKTWREFLPPDIDYTEPQFHAAPSAAYFHPAS